MNNEYPLPQGEGSGNDKNRTAISAPDYDPVEHALSIIRNCDQRQLRRLMDEVIKLAHPRLR